MHAFATDPTRGIFILIFLGIVIGGSRALFTLRVGAVGGRGHFDSFSREALLLCNNVAVDGHRRRAAGHPYPLAVDALGLGKLSVGAPCFQAVFVPLMAPAALLMGAAPLARRKSTSVAELARRLRVPTLLSAVAAVALPLAAGFRALQPRRGTGLAAGGLGLDQHRGAAAAAAPGSWHARAAAFGAWSWRTWA